MQMMPIIGLLKLHLSVYVLSVYFSGSKQFCINQSFLLNRDCVKNKSRGGTSVLLRAVSQREDGTLATKQSPGAVLESGLWFLKVM